MNLVNLILKPIVTVFCRRHTLVKFTLLVVCGIFAMNVIEDLICKYEQHHSPFAKSRVLMQNIEAVESNHIVSIDINQKSSNGQMQRKTADVDNSKNKSFSIHDKRGSFHEEKLPNLPNDKLALTKNNYMDTLKQITKGISKRNVSCGMKLNLDLLQYICKPHRHPQSELTLFTVISNVTTRDLFIINNTLTIWTLLMPKLSPVLFVVYSEHRYHGNRLLDELAMLACELGWTVLQCPHCRDGLPVLGSMFQTVYAISDTTWYGYSQNQVLFDSSLLQALEKLQFYIGRIRPYGLLAGNQYCIKLKQDTFVYDHDSLASHTFNASKDEDGSAVYIITKRFGYPWSKLPPLVIGEPDLETFYLWYSIFYKPVFNMDITDMVLATGQLLLTDITTEPSELRYYEKDQTVTTSKNNSYFISSAFPSFDKYLQDQKYIATKGLTKCLQYKFGYIRSPYARVFRRWVAFLKDHSCRVNKYTLIEPDDDAMETIDIQVDG